MLNFMKSNARYFLRIMYYKISISQINKFANVCKDTKFVKFLNPFFSSDLMM